MNKKLYIILITILFFATTVYCVYIHAVGGTCSNYVLSKIKTSNDVRELANWMQSTNNYMQFVDIVVTSKYPNEIRFKAADTVRYSTGIKGNLCRMMT